MGQKDLRYKQVGLRVNSEEQALLKRVQHKMMSRSITDAVIRSMRMVDQNFFENKN